MTVTLIAAAVLVPLAGADGGAAAAAVGEWLLTFAYVVVVRRARPDLHPSLGSIPCAAAAAAVGVAAAAAALAASGLIDVPCVPNVGAVVVTALAYVAVLAAVRGIPAELVDALLRRDRRLRVSPTQASCARGREMTSA